MPSTLEEADIQDLSPEARQFFSPYVGLPLTVVILAVSGFVSDVLACSAEQRRLYPVTCSGVFTPHRSGETVTKSPYIAPKAGEFEPETGVLRKATPKRVVSLDVDLQPALEVLTEDVASLEARERIRDLIAKFATGYQRVSSTDELGQKHYYSGFPRSVPKVDERKHFYGDFGGINVPDTYFNQHLHTFLVDGEIAKEGEIPKTISDSRVNFIVGTIKGRSYLAVYVGKEIQVLTYVSLGTDAHPTGLRGVTMIKKRAVTLDTPDLQKTEGLVRIEWNKISAQAGGSSMWGAIHVKGGVFFHSSALGINGLGMSHGCVRTPIKYLDKMHQIIQAMSEGEEIVMTFNHKR